MNVPTDSIAEITVVLADDHVIVRDGVRLVLESESDINVVAEAGNSEDTIRYVLGHRPSVLILDLNMPGIPSLEVIPKILEISPETKVIVLTMQNELVYVRMALRAGASGFVVKHSAASELVDAIRAALAGDTYLNPSLGAKLAAAPVASGPPDELTPREIEVLGLLARGLTNPEVADELVLSVRTVETHRANIQRKAGISSRAELMSYARQHDLETKA